MELTEEKKNLNFTLWIKKLKDYDCYSESLINEYGEKIKNCSFNMKEINGACYDGSLIDVILNNICRIGYNINEVAFGLNSKNKLNHPFLSVNLNMLMRVLLLQQISKCEMFIIQSDKWKRDNGFKYDFNGLLNSQLKVGERSAFMCFKHGIKLSEIEYEAMTIIDKTEKEFNNHVNPLTLLVKFINQLASVEIQRKYNYYNTDKNIDIK